MILDTTTANLDAWRAVGAALQERERIGYPSEAAAVCGGTAFVGAVARTERSVGRYQGAIGGAVVGAIVGAAAHAWLGPKGRGSELAWALVGGVLASAAANIITHHTGVTT